MVWTRSWWWRALAALLVLGTGLALYAFAEARRVPVVRRATLTLPDWPAGAPPLRVALATDLHLGDAATDPARLERVVATIAAARPDLVVLTGDFIAGHTAGSAAAHAPALEGALRRLRPPLGVVATLGNHDHWTGEAAVRGALRRAGVTVLENGVARRGPLVIAGIGDDYTGHDRVAATLARAPAGPLLVATHSPDIAPTLPARATLLLAGHTHCGQIRLPLFGAPYIPSRHGARYGCGIIREDARRVVVTAGTGTSMLPFRLGAPPDLWLLTLGPPAPR